MNDEHDDWWGLDDGLTTSRRAVFPRPPQPARAYPASLMTAEPARPGPDHSELFLRARKMFDTIALNLPERISEEELGDALEVIHQLCVEGAPEADINARIWSSLHWVSLHALEDTGVEKPAELAATGTGAPTLVP